MTRKHRFPRRLIAVCLLLTLSLSLLCSCGILRRVISYFSSSDAPDDTVAFYGITVGIPAGFVIDSTQSTAEVRLYERGWYRELIILSCKSAGGAGEEALDEYADAMRKSGCDSSLTEFLGRPAVLTTYTRDGQFCQEILFLYRDAFYAVALRGGTEEAFAGLTGSVSLTGSGTDA